ncbi:circadian clock-controlled protein daywake-like [Bicyclus anynana]|uniref:Circadian clock-controlled protein daywake-like n=1 Tax=Bicyclus anynana TaxID=110368 RepID=A0A6J1MG21_BICAN|nr:circadian clock-controlled protein daywake-like [Bicyclus anynana]
MLSTQSTAALPPIKKCSLHNTTCLTTQAGILKSYLINGIPELGIECLHKMRIDDVNVKKMGLIYTMKNVEVEGLKDAVIDNLSVDMDLQTMRLSMQTSFIINSDYTADGVLLTLPVNGDNKSTIRINDIKLELLILFDIVQNDEGHKIMQLTRYNYGFDVIGNTHYYYKNVYDNDEKKGKKLHSFLNEYWRTMTHTYGDTIVGNIADKIFNVLELYMASQNLNDIATY